MKHRIFTAINLPESIKNKLGNYQKKWPELPIRWTRKGNLHITLCFIGYINEPGILDICKAVKKTAEKHSSFLVNLNKICYGPPKKMPPRMVWVMGEGSPEFSSLKGDLERSLLNSENIKFSPENREPLPHITLGRIKQWEWRRIEPEERPDVNEEINFNFEVDSIEVMESRLKRGGAEYTVLESMTLNKS